MLFRSDLGAQYPVTVDPLASSPAWTEESNQVGANYGFNISTAGDVNGDGYSDVIVGADGYGTETTNEGRAYLYLGSASGLSATASWKTESNQQDARYGCSVSTAGDVNGDGYSDVIVGAYGYNNGRAFLYLGSSSGLSTTASRSEEHTV